MGEVIILPIVRVESEGLLAQERRREELGRPAENVTRRRRRIEIEQSLIPPIDEGAAS